MFQVIPSPPPHPQTSLHRLIPSLTTKGPIHKIGLMGQTKKSKHENMSNNLYSSSSSLT